MIPTGSAEGGKATESRKRTASGAPAAAALQSANKPGDGDDTSTASTTISKEGVAGPSGSRQASERGGGSDSDSHREGDAKSEVVYDDDEVEAASNLATFILAASHVAPAKPKKAQPSSAPAALGSALAVGGAGGGGTAADSDDPSVSKKQRRREKNRASAQQSRQRKKCHLDELENRVEHLEGERRALQVRLETLTSQNDVLRRQLDKQKQVSLLRPGCTSQAANSQHTDDTPST